MLVNCSNSYKYNLKKTESLLYFEDNFFIFVLVLMILLYWRIHSSTQQDLHLLYHWNSHLEIHA